MGLFGPPNVEKLQASGNIKGLIKALSYKKDKEVCLQACDCLIKTGAPAVQLIIEHLKQGKVEFPDLASKVLEDIGDAAVEPLINILGDKESPIRSLAARSLGIIGNAEAIDSLIDTLNDEKISVRINAANALGCFSDSRIVEPLINALEDKEGLVRDAVIESLGKINDPRAVKAFKEETAIDRKKKKDRIDAIQKTKQVHRQRNKNMENMRMGIQTKSGLSHPSAVECITLQGVDFVVVNKVGDFRNLALQGQSCALLINTKDYASALQSLKDSLHALSSPLYCRGCLWEFPQSYSVALIGLFGLENKIHGATPGFEDFGSTATCPKCGSKESYLVHYGTSGQEVTNQDVVYLREYWRSRAKEEWSSSSDTVRECTWCGDFVKRNEGYCLTASFYCDDCCNKILEDAVEKLRADPYYFGAGELDRARKYFKNH